MLKKVMVMLASKYLAIKTKMRAIETRLIIHSLLLRDKKMVRHLFRQRRYFNLPNTVDDENYKSSNIAAHSIATTPLSVGHLVEENKAEDKMGMEVDDEYNLPNTVEGEDDKSDNFAALVNNSSATSPVNIVQLAEESKTKAKMGKKEDYKYLDLRHSLFEDNQVEDESTSVIEMVKNAKEGQGKEFRLEDDIDQVADLFIRRFHHQIRLQKFHPQSPLSH